MDVAALAQTLLSARTDQAVGDAQISLLKKAMTTQAAAATKLLDSLSLPLASEGSVGRNVNTYA